MRIEERDLIFTQAAPLRAWRLFRLRRDDQGWVLSAPLYHDPHPTPWPRMSTAASCHRGHPAPAPGCRCGIYAVIQGTLDSLPGYLLDTAHDNDPWAYCEVACHGRVFVDLRGVRAERADVISIALAQSCWPDQGALAGATRSLAERYGTPVGTLEGVPGWVTGNLRSQGPPPDEATLDLGTLGLEA